MPSSFTVYCDSPATDAVATVVGKPAAAKAGILSSSSSRVDPNVITTPSSPLASSAEKENLHPVTGERCSSSSAGKKRKTNGVLATKIVKKQKSEENLKAVKPKPRAASSGSKGKSKGKGKKKARASPLPRVDEDADTAAERERLLQVDIDSRVYELTVSPLADVTQAYDAGFDVETLLASFTPEESAKFRRATSTEPEIRDYFSPKHYSSSRPTPPAFEQGSSTGPSTKVFNTPERRHIYSAFTFTTPSPSSERFRKANSRSASPCPSPVIAPLDLSTTKTTSTTTA
ncbi:hypothetical protein FB45DRAFT_926365 [Roridomyces roridus]|uniref:Uncharacterized protein n=1 Tax=Roridomyces roridus TaxID=1738132 RepID=A0AAD7FH59_9AGAR|nr:hypothetical protein FB45DRAFT_926365 [Roridomyces roridus]